MSQSAVVLQMQRAGDNEVADFSQSAAGEQRAILRDFGGSDPLAALAKSVGDPRQ